MAFGLCDAKSDCLRSLRRGAEDRRDDVPRIAADDYLQQSLRQSLRQSHSVRLISEVPLN